MKISAIVKVDSKGRVTIPQTIRGALGIEKGMVMVIIGDIERREIYLTPLSSAEGENIVYIEVTLKDRPGALAEVARTLAEHKVDIVASRCASVVRGEEGVCFIVADFSHATIAPEKLREELEKLEVVIQAKTKGVEAGLEEV